MNEFEKSLLKYFTEEQLKKIQTTVIGIAGAGGLGSNCAFNLVRSGFKKFYIYDFDVVEINNLNRQFYFFDQIGLSKVLALKRNLLKINPDLDIKDFKLKIIEENINELFKDCDVVIEAFDNAEYKALIVNNFIDKDKFIVSVSGLAGIGNSDEIKIKRIKKNFYLIGDNKSGTCSGLLPYSPRVNIAAAKQSDIILEWVLKNE